MTLQWRWRRCRRWRRGRRWRWRARCVDYSLLDLSEWRSSLFIPHTHSLSLTDERVRGMKIRILHCFRTSKELIVQNVRMSKGRCLNGYWLKREMLFFRAGSSRQSLRWRRGETGRSQCVSLSLISNSLSIMPGILWQNIRLWSLNSDPRKIEYLTLQLCTYWSLISHLGLLAKMVFDLWSLATEEGKINKRWLRSNGDEVHLITNLEWRATLGSIIIVIAVWQTIWWEEEWTMKRSKMFENQWEMVSYHTFIRIDTSHVNSERFSLISNG